MKAVDDLRGFDERWLPLAARRFAAVQRSMAIAVGTIRDHIHPLPARLRRGMLDALDAAVARRRWGLPARQPAVALMVALAVLVGGLGVAATRPAPGHHVTSTPSDLGVDSTYVGPHVGDDVNAYLAARRNELTRRAQAKPTAVTVAVISLVDYTAISVAADLIGDVTARRVFFGVHIAKVPTEVGQSTVTSFVKDTTTAFKANAKARAKLALTFKQLADAAPARTQPERKFRDFYRSFAEANRLESAALAKLCACVFGIVVEAPLGALQGIAADPRVRLVDPAPEGVQVSRLGFRALSPDESGKITSGPASPLAELSR